MKSTAEATKDMIWAEVVKTPRVTKEELVRLNKLFESATFTLIGYEDEEEMARNAPKGLPFV